MKEISVISYNIHKGFSLFRREYTLTRIKGLLEREAPDLVFLQEVRGLCPKGDYSNQMEHLADTLWPHTAYGKNAVFSEAHHGNAILSRFPIKEYENKNVSLNAFEQRGILYAKIHPAPELPDVHVFCLHLNLLEKDRFRQVEELLAFIESKVKGEEPVLVAGDFNDWTGRLTKKLSEKLDLLDDPKVDTKTYPSFFPVFELDRMFGRHLKVKSIQRLDGRWKQLSDHLPLAARIQLF